MASSMDVRSDGEVDGQLTAVSVQNLREASKERMNADTRDYHISGQLSVLEDCETAEHLLLRRLAVGKVEHKT